ncbi:MAG TPA: TetR/AcrR family transcriptional regulator [Gaiellaceae bacterium]|jgi:AcrR family transcriptional regulator
MPRATTHTADGLLDAAERLVATRGCRALTVEGLSAATGAPIGSIYHRFASRSVLAATLWIRAVERFQEGLIAELAGSEPIPAGIDAALHTLRWSRRNPHGAQMLLLYRDVDFLEEDLPEPWRLRAAGLNAPLLAALRSYTERLYGSSRQYEVRRVGLAVIDIPYGAVHRHLAVGKPIPAETDALVAQAVEALLCQGMSGA